MRCRQLCCCVTDLAQRRRWTHGIQVHILQQCKRSCAPVPRCRGVITLHRESFPRCAQHEALHAVLLSSRAHVVTRRLLSFGQAIFKDTRESLLRVGTMRFSDYIVSQRPMPPSRPLLVSNNRHSLSFRFGIDVQSQLSDDVHATSIVSSSAPLIDSRASHGDLSVFQSTPSGDPATRLQLILQVIALPQCASF
jgi:hypothetical protein